MGYDFLPSDAQGDTGDSCFDGIKNGSEGDIDCGGPCSPCAQCEGCATSADCGALSCVDERCTVYHELFVDWVQHCSQEGTTMVSTPDLPVGSYTVTAMESAGSHFPVPSHAPPERGYMYRIRCVDVDLSAIATPPTINYATPQESFAKLMQLEVDDVTLGGPLTCYESDSNCVDNLGGVQFSLHLQCP